MALGTVTKIMENGVTILVEVNVEGSVYAAFIDRILFDAQPTVLAKQALVTSVLTNARRSARGYENTFTSLVGTVITIPD